MLDSGCVFFMAVYKDQKLDEVEEESKSRNGQMIQSTDERVFIALHAGVSHIT